MRRRRAERCVVKGEVALDAGFLDDARAAVEEARRLDASAPGLFELQERISLTPLLAEPSTPSRSKRPWVAAVACAAVFIGAAITWRALAPAEVPDSVAEPMPASVPAEPVIEDRRTSLPNAVGIRQMDIIASVTGFEPPRQTTEVALQAPLVPESTVARGTEPPVATPAPEVPLEPLAMPEPLPAPSPPPVVPALRTNEPSPDVITASAPPPPPAPPVDERARVRSVLSRYEAAYSGLDASAARAVWPGVNERALAHAFDGLRSQNLSLGRCDVEVTGSIARAECAGSASWTPKIGSGRTESRRWAFDLRNASGAWQIVRAEVR